MRNPKTSYADLVRFVDRVASVPIMPSPPNYGYTTPSMQLQQMSAYVQQMENWFTMTRELVIEAKRLANHEE